MGEARVIARTGVGAREDAFCGAEAAATGPESCPRLAKWHARRLRGRLPHFRELADRGMGPGWAGDGIAPREALLYQAGQVGRAPAPIRTAGALREERWRV